MPSTRISICLICACAAGTTTIEPSRTSSRFFSYSWFLLSLTVQTKLLCNSETDVAADRHEQWARGMRHSPVHPEPNVHAGAHTEVGRHASQQNVTAAPSLAGSGDAIIL